MVVEYNVTVQDMLQVSFDGIVMILFSCIKRHTKLSYQSTLCSVVVDNITYSDL